MWWCFYFILAPFFTKLKALDPADVPPTINFTVSFRDQTFFNRDFEAYNGGCINATLNNMTDVLLQGTLPNMVFTPPSLRGSNQFCGPCYSGCNNVTMDNYGTLFFDDYYHDNPGYNFAYDTIVPFNLSDAAEGLYTYESDSFFPVDTVGYLRETLGMASNNFGFTTYISLRFYYRGNEVFMFEGDDDFWVYIDNIRRCDLPGLHPSVICNISLDDLGLKLNTTHTMQIFHAERHTFKSKFRVTTSVLPLNSPPDVTNISYSILEGANVTINLAPFIRDIDNDYSTLTYRLIQPAPLNGIIVNASNNNILKLPTANYSTAVQFTYIPNYLFHGMDYIYYMASDNNLNSTLGVITIKVVWVDVAPVPPNITQYNATVGQKLMVNISASDVDSPCANLSYYLGSYLWLGNGYISRDSSWNAYFSYTPVYAGYENIVLRVSDGYFVETYGFTIMISPAPFNPNDTTGPNQYLQVGVSSQTGGLPILALVGIICGGAIVILVIGALFLYCCYMQCVAKSLEEEWEQEVQLYQNPLYVKKKAPKPKPTPRRT